MHDRGLMMPLHHSVSMARNIERMLWPYVYPGTAQRPLRSYHVPSVRVP